MRECIRTTAVPGATTERGGNSDPSRACFGVGYCDAHGECVCDAGFTGTRCDETIEPPNVAGLVVGLAMLVLILVLLAAVLFYRYRQLARKHEGFLEASTGLPPAVESEKTYALFLSHVWATGQDQVAVIKRRLQTLLPGVRIFLDVEDLEDIGKGAAVRRVYLASRLRYTRPVNSAVRAGCAHNCRDACMQCSAWPCSAHIYRACVGAWPRAALKRARQHASALG